MSGHEADHGDEGDFAVDMMVQMLGGTVDADASIEDQVVGRRATRNHPRLGCVQESETEWEQVIQSNKPRVI